MSQTILVVLALVIVLALIGVAAWLVRKFGGSSLGSSAGRGRMPRLAVIDAAAVDGRRRLVLVRRDNVEHLLMIGGPTDIVVEPNIVRGTPQQAPQRAPAGTELPPPPARLPDAGWPEPDASRNEFEIREPAAPELPPRAPRVPFGEDTRRPSPPIADRSLADSMSSFTPEPIVRPEPPMRPADTGRAIPRSERNEPIPPRMPRASEAPKAPPPPVRPPPRPDAALSAADQNLADMAQRLEAALRRPGSEMRLDSGETRPSVAPPDRPGALGPDVTASRTPPRPDAAPPRAPAGPSPGTPFENLEDEMASLLGRPKPPA